MRRFVAGRRRRRLLALMRKGSPVLGFPVVYVMDSLYHTTIHKVADGLHGSKIRDDRSNGRNLIGRKDTCGITVELFLDLLSSPGIFEASPVVLLYPCNPASSCRFQHNAPSELCPGYELGFGDRMHSTCEFNDLGISDPVVTERLDP